MHQAAISSCSLAAPCHWLPTSSPRRLHDARVRPTSERVGGASISPARPGWSAAAAPWLSAGHGRGAAAGKASHYPFPCRRDIILAERHVPQPAGPGVDVAEACAAWIGFSAVDTGCGCRDLRPRARRTPLAAAYERGEE